MSLDFSVAYVCPIGLFQRKMGHLICLDSICTPSTAILGVHSDYTQLCHAPETFLAEISSLRWYRILFTVSVVSCRDILKVAAVT